MTLHAIPAAGAFPSNMRRALTTGITMYRKISHVSQKPSERMNHCTDAAFAYAMGDLLRSLMSVGHSSSMIILSKALRTWRSRSIMMKFVAKWVSTGKRMDKLGDNLRNMACEAWWLFDEDRNDPGLFHQLLHPFFLAPIFQKEVQTMCGTSLHVHVGDGLKYMTTRSSHNRSIVRADLNNIVNSDLF